MKILIAYDGSGHSEAAIDDLCRAGLPPDGTALVVSVAEVWLPPPDSVDNSEITSVWANEVVRTHLEKGERILAEASTRVKQAERRVRSMLPSWTVTSSATYGSPGWEILAASEEAQSDLIIVGSQGHTALGRFFLGSVSQKVVTEAHCSVRVSRGRNEVDPAPARIVVGFDGSRGSTAAVDAVAGRSWPEGTEVRLVTATEVITPSAFTRFVPPVARMVEEVNVTEEHWISRLAAASVAKLTDAGVRASHHIHPGNPKDILVEEAESWGADCIFVGANAYGSRLERALLGSTSSAVTTRAHCSVEVVRTRATTAPDLNGKQES